MYKGSNRNEVTVLHVLRTRIHTLEQRIDVLLNTARICLCWCHYLRSVCVGALELFEEACKAWSKDVFVGKETKEIFTQSVS